MVLTSYHFSVPLIVVPKKSCAEDALLILLRTTVPGHDSLLCESNRFECLSSPSLAKVSPAPIYSLVTEPLLSSSTSFDPFVYATSYLLLS